MYVPAWVIPILLTVGMAAWMLRPYQSSGDYDFGSIFRVLWLIPILFVWVVYFAVMYWSASNGTR